MERMTGVEAAFSTVLHALLRRGQATGRSGGLVRFSLSFSRLFYILFFDFSRLFYIGRCLPDSYFLHVFERDTPMDLVI